MNKNKIQIKVGGKLLNIKIYENEIHYKPTKEDLEQLLNLTKELQEKLANKEIQELQDSKNFLTLGKINEIEFSNTGKLYAKGNALFFKSPEGAITKLG